MKVVVNRCYGGFGLSEKAYEWLIEKGIPARPYVEQERGEDGLYKKQPLNEGRVIFDRALYKDRYGMGSIDGRYWDSWTRDSRDDPLVVGVVEALGEKANGRFANLEVVDIPDGIEWEIDDYDGMEHVAEKHRTW